jgi:hypothetical protein
VFKKITGVFTAKATNIPINKNTCVIYAKSFLYIMSISVQPVKDETVIIDNNMNNDPKNVYKKK